MIIVNIKAPALEKEYNFSLDEKSPVGDLIEEIVDLILQKEGIQFSEELQKKEVPEMALCSIEQRVQCDKNATLSDYGICSGAELVLV